MRGLLDGSPYLRASLALFAELVREAGGGLVADIGCGPGYVTHHLHDLGVDAFGIDLSAEMIAIARRDYPDLRFEVGTMTDLDLADDSVTGLLAFWSVIHVPDHAVPEVFAQFRRVMRPGGPLLVGFHVGDEACHTTEGYSGRSIDVDSHRRRPARLPAGCGRRVHHRGRTGDASGRGGSGGDPPREKSRVKRRRRFGSGGRARILGVP